MEVNLYNTNKKYNVIYADPPWSYQQWCNKKQGVAKAHYETMKQKDIEELPVERIADKNCILFIVDAKQRYSKQDIEAMGLFICKAYGDQFTVEELKNPETGLDAAGLILEFQFIDMGIADDLTKRMEKIEKNFQSGK